MKEKRQMIEFLQFLVHLKSIDNTPILCGSNLLHLLVQMYVNLRYKNFENIKISNTSLVRANFVRCDLGGSEFDNVNISGINLNCVKLFHYKWQNIRVDQLHHLKGNLQKVKQVSFQPNGTMLASCAMYIFSYMGYQERKNIIYILQQRHNFCVLLTKQFLRIILIQLFNGILKEDDENVNCIAIIVMFIQYAFLQKVLFLSYKL
ncbi:unnamed protein product [Paramecium primaurelia]|uniref:Pentapeptide repeat-containing protein n=1 Tax=Paramecium primaurelia TaxID=5886 RepID=A0A8S1QRX5_PARPR|nr:unnamed protein product [Paramecium primaurelia]